MNAILVPALPVLSQADFPEFPVISTRKTLVCFGTELHNMERETAAGCVVNICLRAQSWRAVSADEFIATLGTHPMGKLQPMGVANALWSLVDEGLLQVIACQETSYFVPTPRLANIVLANRKNLRTF